MQNIQCGGSSFLLIYFSILFCLISFWYLSFQAQLFVDPYLMGGRTLGLHIVGCWGCLAIKAEIVEMSPKLSLGSLNSSIIWRAKLKICNARYTKANGALWKEKPIQNENTRKCRNYMFINQKFQPVVTERKNLREVPSKRRRVPWY